MKTISTFTLILFVLIFASCKKNTSSPGNIPANAAPSLYVPFNGHDYFVTAQVLTSENYYEYVGGSACVGTSPKLQTLTNTKTNGQKMGLGCAYGAMTWPYHTTSFFPGLYCNAFKLFGTNNGCIVPPMASMSTGYSDTTVIGPVSTWAFYGGTNGDSLIWSYIDAGAVPTISDISSAESISTSDVYTLSALGAVSGDSVIFSITGPSATISRRLGPNANSYTFSAEEMSSLGTTGGYKTGLLQITPFNVHSLIINGDTCNFAKETCNSKYVILQ